MTTVCLIELTNRISLIDDFGHHIDKPLCEEFQRRITKWVRPQDQSKLLLPDRFCIALEGVNAFAHVRVVASNVEKLFDQPFHFQGVDMMLQARMGFIIIDSKQAKLSQDALIKQAALSLNQARKEDKLFSIYHEKLPPIERANIKMIKGLENALVQGQFRLHYQPKIHPTYKTAVGAEALLRWYLTEGKVFPPEAFLTHAQASTFIMPITYWTIRSAVARAASWKNDLSVSVNIANRALCDPELESILTSTINLHNFDPRRLILEVSDDCLAPMAIHLRKPLIRLRSMGFKISIDRFAVGQCSLLCFRNLPADELKIHRSFIKKMTTSKKDERIVKTCINIARDFGLRAVAVGAEDEQTVNHLADSSCDAIQGFFFDKPLTIDDFETRYLT